MARFLASLLLFCVLLNAGCGPSEKLAAESKFLKKYPTYTVLAVEEDGNGEWGRYFFVRYGKPNDQKKYMRIVRLQDGELEELSSEQETKVDVPPR